MATNSVKTLKMVHMKKNLLRNPTIPFTLAQIKITYVDINIAKYVQDLYEENCKTDERYQRTKWRDIPCPCKGRLNVVRMSVLPNLIYRFIAIPIKIPARYFIAINKLILKFIWRSKIPRIPNTVLKEKNKIGGLLTQLQNLL